MQSPEKYVIISCIIFTLLILILGISIIIIIAKYQKAFHQYSISLEALKLEHQNQILTSRVEIQEQTFANISREIHDNIGQKLSFLKFYLLVPKDSVNHTHAEAVEVLTTTIDDLRDIGRTMNSDLILDNGLFSALDIEINRIKRLKQLDLSLNIDGEAVFLPANKELILFRIIQESLHNTLRHAMAKSICIAFKYGGDKLDVIIEDDGKGFCTSAVINGSGLKNMKKRTEILNGQFTVMSSLGEGTKIKIEIPIEQ